LEPLLRVGPPYFLGRESRDLMQHPRSPRNRNRFSAWCLVLLVVLNSFVTAPQAHAYSVLSHEEIVDLTWHDNIVPVLMARFPGTTPDAIHQAHAYAYGGCIIQDIGYYPFGDKFFSDLLHYVRTGDFVNNLIMEASDVNELAFALGALAHYSADTYGHPAVNAATAQEYPKLRDKYGNVVTYDDNPTAHLQTEFGFDVVEVAHNRYAPLQFHDFIGFEVSKPLLERAFRDTYGFEVGQILTHEDLAIGSYRRSVSGLIPKMTRVALVDYGKQIEKENPGFDRRAFLYRIKRSQYEKDFGKEYQKPGVGSHILAFFLRLLPKVGPLRALSLHIPNSGSQALFLKSIETTTQHYRAYLDTLRGQSIRGGSLELADLNLDTGGATISGQYRLTDETYSKLLSAIEKHPQTPVPVSLRSNVLAFYQSSKDNFVRHHAKQWQQTEANLHLLENAHTVELKVSDQPTSQQQPSVPVASPN
jgi:Zinc dependent phospholipase C